MTRRQPIFPDADERFAVLEQTRARKMARSSHAFVRGNTVQFYDWLASLELGRLPQGPPVWICGDCHVGNLGPVGDSAGRHTGSRSATSTRPSSGIRPTI